MICSTLGAISGPIDPSVVEHRAAEPDGRCCRSELTADLEREDDPPLGGRVDDGEGTPRDAEGDGALLVGKVGGDELADEPADGTASQPGARDESDRARGPCTCSSRTIAERLARRTVSLRSPMSSRRITGFVFLSSKRFVLAFTRPNQLGVKPGARACRGGRDRGGRGGRPAVTVLRWCFPWAGAHRATFCCGAIEADERGVAPLVNRVTRPGAGAGVRGDPRRGTGL